MTKSTITRERLEQLAAGQSGFNLRIATLEESQQLARIALAAMDSELVGKPFMYGIADPDGNAYIDEFCVSDDLGLVEDTVNELNYDREEGDELNYSVVALYRHAQPVPVVPDDVLNALQDVARIRADLNNLDGDCRGLGSCLWEAEERLLTLSAGLLLYHCWHSGLLLR